MFLTSIIPVHNAEIDITQRLDSCCEQNLSMDTALQSKNQEPLYFLDGIRGLMALNVILCHFVVVYYPQMYFLNHADSLGGFLSLFAKTPLSVLINGDVAVRYFFVLTGFLVGRTSFLKNIQPHQIVSRSIKRYTRLFPIVAISTIFTFFTMIFQLQKHHSIVDLALNGSFLTYYCDFEPTIFNLLINIFVYPFIRTSDYVGPFWSIRYEFWGYILTLVVCHLLKEYKYRRVGYAIIAVLCFSQLSSDYVPFILGAFVADLLYNQNPDCFDKFCKNWIHSKFVVFSCLIIGLYFACCPMSFTTIYRVFEYVPKLTTDLLRSLGVAMVLFAMHHLPKLQTWFSGRLFLSLGKVSFEVYALHWPIMLTLQAWLFSKFIVITSYDFAAMAAFFATLPVIYAASHCVRLLLKKVRNN